MVQDRSFTFVLKTPPASVLIKKAAKIDKGSGQPQENKVGEITKEQLRVSFSFVDGWMAD
jgi:large subunit ribosomal protein L11